jgi:hypothetical protein
LPEPFVSAQEAAKFVGISRRFLTELARRTTMNLYTQDDRDESRRHKAHF